MLIINQNNQVKIVIYLVNKVFPYYRLFPVYKIKLKFTCNRSASYD